MKNIKVICFIILIISFSSSAQVSFTTFYNYVTGLPEAGRQAAVDSFITIVNQQGGAPVIEAGTAYFIFKGSANSVSVSGDFNGWSSGNALNKIPSTNLYYYGKEFEPNARLDYKLIINGSNWILDPLNSHTCGGGYGPNSELAMPSYIQPWEIKYQSGIRHGSKQQFSLYSVNLSAAYTVTVYMPPGYSDLPDKHYPTAYFHDGSEYLSLGYADNIADNLLDSNLIRPFIGVFVTPINRNDEYAGSKRNAYRLFFANELVPVIDSLYRTIKAPEQRLIIGTSYGANISGLICYYHSNIFGKAGLHSPALYPNNYEVINLFGAGVKLPVDIYSVWGTYESVYQYMRPWRDTLLNKGYTFKWAEFPEGHSWGLWRATTDNFLKFFFPPEAASVNDYYSRPQSVDLLSNYPNPFNPSTTIEFMVRQAGRARIELFDINGRMAVCLTDKEYSAGKYNVLLNAGSLSGGVYLLKMKTVNGTASRKIMLLK